MDNKYQSMKKYMRQDGTQISHYKMAGSRRGLKQPFCAKANPLLLTTPPVWEYTGLSFNKASRIVGLICFAFQIAMRSQVSQDVLPWGPASSYFIQSSC